MKGRNKPPLCARRTARGAASTRSRAPVYASVNSASEVCVGNARAPGCSVRDASVIAARGARRKRMCAPHAHIEIKW